MAAVSRTGLPVAGGTTRPRIPGQLEGESPEAALQRLVDADPNHQLPDLPFLNDQYRVRNGRVEYHDPDILGNTVKYGLLGLGGAMTAGLAAEAFGPGIAANIAGGAGSGAMKSAANGEGWKSALVNAGIGGVTGGVGGGIGTGVANTATGSGASGMDWKSILLDAAGGRNADGSINWSGLAKTGLGVAGALEQGREGQRATDTNNIITRDTQGINAQAQNNNARAQAAQIEMQQKAAADDALNNAYKNALRSSLALNMSDVHFNRPDGVPDISMSGGARPSAIGAQGKEAAGIMNAKAIEALLNPASFTPLPMPSAYDLTNLPRPSAVDNVLGAVGAAGKVLDANQARTEASKQNELIAQLLANSQQQVATPLPAATGLTVPVVSGSGIGPSNWGQAIRF
jgi:hypothetical protein